MRWSAHITGGPKRVNLAAVAVGNSIYSFGGYCTQEDYAIQKPIDVHILNPVNFRWQRVIVRSGPDVTPFQRYGHTAVAFGKYIFLWGGRNDERACNTLFRFDSKTLTWDRPTVSGAIPGARDGHSAVIIRQEMVVFGGYEEDIGLFSQDIYSLNLNTLHWSFVPVNGIPPSFRDFHTATPYLDRYMYVFGGRGDRNGPLHTSTEMYCNTVVCLDIERREWFRPKVWGKVPEGRRSHSAFMHDSFMYICFGYNGIKDIHFNDFYRFDPESGEWSEVRPLGRGPAPRRRQGCVLNDKRVFVFGGTSPSPSLIAINFNEDEDDETASLVDHDDLFVLDLQPSLKTLCMLRVIESKLDTSTLPLDLKQEIMWMKLPNKITTHLSSG